jgi:hypothetical protein
MMESTRLMADIIPGPKLVWTFCPRLNVSTFDDKADILNPPAYCVVASKFYAEAVTAKLKQSEYPSTLSEPQKPTLPP